MSCGGPDLRRAGLSPPGARVVFAELTTHFLGRLLRPPILTEAGADSFRQVLAGVVAAALAFGLFLPRVFHERHSALSAMPSPEPYLAALAADQLFMICVSMLIAGAAATALAPALFPDDIDFVVLAPLPIARDAIFLAKVTSMAIVLGTIVAASLALLSVAFPIVTNGRWSVHSIPARVAAHLAASGLAAVFVCGFIVSLQGVIAVLTRGRLARMLSLAVQGASAFVLVGSLPVIASVPGLADSIEQNTGTLLSVPPGWFLGLEQWALGSTSDLDARLAGRAVAAALAVLIVSAVSGAVAYRRFDRLAARPPAALEPSTTRWARRALARLSEEPSGTLLFTAATLRRSGLHQFVVFGIAACGLALVLNGVMAAVAPGWLGRKAAMPFLLRRALVGMPVVLTFTSMLALRAAWRLPADLRANWIFRLADAPALQRVQMQAVERAFVVYALVPSLVVSAAAQLAVLDAPQAVMSLVLAALLGAVLVQIEMLGWRRIPFTCAYVPGQRQLAFTTAIFLGRFFLIVSVGGALVGWGVTHPSRFVMLSGLLLALFSWLRRHRLREREQALEFEDEPADAILTLSLQS